MRRFFFAVSVVVLATILVANPGGVTVEAIEMVRQIPSTFLGVVFGSFFSLGGVVLSNRESARRLTAQLTHERRLREADREVVLRKEIYLAAMESFSTGFVAIESISNIDIPDDRVFAEYRKISPAISKVYVIAGDDLVKSVARVTNELSASMLRLTLKRIPLSQKREEIGILDDQVARSSKVTAHMLELMTAFNLEGANDQRRWKVIEGNFKFEQKVIEDTLKKKDRMVRELIEDRIEFTKECVAVAAEINEMLINVVVSIRNELGVPIDENFYTSVVRDSNQRMAAEVTDFFEKARSLLAAQSDDRGTATVTVPPR